MNAVRRAADRTVADGYVLRADADATIASKRLRLDRGESMAKKTARGAAATSRGRLKSMRVTDGFRAFVLEQLALVNSVRPRPMFGGIGLYAGEVFFGMLAADTLYLKTNEHTRGRYEAAGMAAFKPYADKPMTMPYHQVPATVLEDSSELAVWVTASIDVAKAARAAKARKARR